ARGHEAARDRVVRAKDEPTPIDEYDAIRSHGYPRSTCLSGLLSGCRVLAFGDELCVHLGGPGARRAAPAARLCLFAVVTTVLAVSVIVLRLARAAGALRLLFGGRGLVVLGVVLLRLARAAGPLRLLFGGLGRVVLGFVLLRLARAAGPLRLLLRGLGLLAFVRSEEHTSELQSREKLVLRPLVEKK